MIVSADHVVVRTGDANRIKRFLSGRGRVLLISGPSGIGKSTLLGHLHRGQDLGWRCRVLIDLDELLGGMLHAAHDPDDAALVLVRRLASGLAQAAPWWRRRSALRLARSIGNARRDGGIEVRQRASFGGKILSSPVTIRSPLQNQMERRIAWVDGLLEVARVVGGRPYLLLLDNCERLRYLDDLSSEARDRREAANVTGWFYAVLDEVFVATPAGKAIFAGSPPPKARYDRHELRPWSQRETCSYLLGKGVEQSLVAALAKEMSGLPVEVSWIAESIGELASEFNLSPSGDWLSDRPKGEPWRTWLSNQVLSHLTERQRRVIEVAAVLRVFTRQSLEAVADEKLPVDWFERFSRRSFVQQLAGSEYYRINPTVRGWIQTVLQSDDAHRPEDAKTMPRLHARAAEYYQSVRGDEFSVDEAYHRFAVGDDSLSAAWHSLVQEAITVVRYDIVGLLVGIALAPENIQQIRAALPSIFARAASTQALLADSFGELDTALYWHRQSVNANKDAGNSLGEADALLFSAKTGLRRGAYLDAERDLAASLKLYRRIGNRHGEASATFHLGRCAFAVSQFDKAVQLLRRSLKAYEAVGDTSGQIDALVEVGTCSLRRGDLAPALDAFTKAMALVGDDGRLQQRAAVLLGLGRLARHQGRTREAEELAGQALEIFIAINSRSGEAEALTQVGRVQYGNEKLELAEALFRRAIAIDKELGDSRSQVDTMLVLGQLLIDQRRFEQAAVLLAEMKAIIGRFGDDPRTQAVILYFGGRLALLRGRPSESEELLEDSLAAARKLGDGVLEVYSLFELALAVRDLGEMARAEQLIREVLRKVKIARDARTESFALQELAELLISRGAPDARKAVERAIDHHAALGDQAVVARLRRRLKNLPT